MPDRPGRARRHRRSRSPTRAYVAEVYRAGHRLGAPEPARRRARASGSPGARRCATSSCRRRSGASLPPLLNDFISLQKDVALVSILGPARGVPGRADRGVVELQLHAAGGRRAAVPVRDDPAGADRRPHAARARRPAVTRRRSRSAASRRPTASAPVLRGIDLAVHEHARGRADRRVGLGQVDAAALHRPARGDRRRRRAARRRGRSPTRRSTRSPCAAGSGMVFQAFNLFPHLTVLENVVLAPVRAHGVAARGGRGAGARAAGALRARRPRGRHARPPVGRPAAARGDRARAGHAAARAAARRGHERARPRARRRGARASCASSRPRA